MYDAHRNTDPPSDAILVDLEVGRELDMRGDKNRSWNLRTLQLMQRAGALEFARGAEGSRYLTVRPAAVHHLDAQFWELAIEQLREELRADYSRAARLLGRLVRSRDKCLSAIFEECYRSETYNLPVVRACGGCPACRNAKGEPTCGRIIPRRMPLEPFAERPCGAEMQRFICGRRLGFIFYPAGTGADELPGVLGETLWWLASQNVTNFVTDAKLTPVLWQLSIEQPNLTIFWHAKPPREFDLVAKQPTALVLTHSDPDWWPKFWNELCARAAQMVILAPADLRCPDHPGRLVRDVLKVPALDLAVWEDRFLA